MRVVIPIRVLCTVAALSLFAGCSSGFAVSPKPTIPDNHKHLVQGHVSALLDPFARLMSYPIPSHHNAGFYSCPATGPLTYVSDLIAGINIYSGTLAGQAPCGALTLGLQNPGGMFVQNSTHELYVANTFGHDILVYKRGSTAPIRTFVDPTGQEPLDVTVASTGIVIASNRVKISGGAGSISTWKSNGTFINNYPMVTDIQGGWVTVQAGAAVTIFFNDIDIGPPIHTALWTGSCPGGVCGAFTLEPPATTTTGYPAGLRSRAADTQLLEIDPTTGIGGTRLNYAVPLFPAPTTCSIGGAEPLGFDMNSAANAIFYADTILNIAGEINASTCALIGTVPGNTGGGMPIGVAHDPPAPL